MVQRPRVWLPWVDGSRTLEDRKNFIRGALKQFAQSDGFTAGIWHEGQLAGVVGYLGIDRENRGTELGYWLGREFEGRGLVTAAAPSRSGFLSTSMFFLPPG